MNHVSRRAFITQVGAGIAVSLLGIACDRFSNSASPEGPTPTTADARQPRSGGTFVLGTIAPIPNASPYPSSVGTRTFWWAMFDTLVRLDERRQPVPHLAESWTVSDDRLTLTFKLRPDVKFQSGRPFTAEQAKWSIEYGVDPKTGVTAGAELKGVQVTARDSSTLELRLPKVMPHVFALLMFIFMIDPESEVDRAPVGTGPFKMDGLDPGNELRMLKHQQYWRADRPLLEGVTIRTVADASALLVNLESGAVNAAYCLASDVARVRANPHMTTLIAGGEGNYCYLMNVSAPPFDDRRIRQALSLALNRQRFATAVMYGLVEPSYVMWPRTSPAWDASQDIGEFNLDKARQLLAAAGYPNGLETKIQTTTGEYPELFEFNQVFQSDLASINVNASIETLEFEQYVAIRNGARFPAMLSHAYVYADSDPALAFTATPLRPNGNITHFTSDTYTQLVNAAKQEPDWNNRLALYHQIGLLLKDEAFLIPVANLVTPWR